MVSWWGLLKEYTYLDLKGKGKTQAHNGTPLVNKTFFMFMGTSKYQNTFNRETTLATFFYSFLLLKERSLPPNSFLEEQTHWKRTKINKSKVIFLENVFSSQQRGITTSAWCSSFCCRTSIHNSARWITSSSFFLGCTSSLYESKNEIQTLPLCMLGTFLPSAEFFQN